MMMIEQNHGEWVAKFEGYTGRGNSMELAILDLFTHCWSAAQWWMEHAC